jgi:hypothetical protein
MYMHEEYTITHFRGKDRESGCRLRKLRRINPRSVRCRVRKLRRINPRSVGCRVKLLLVAPPLMVKVTIVVGEADPRPWSGLPQSESCLL